MFIIKQSQSPLSISLSRVHSTQMAGSVTRHNRSIYFFWASVHNLENQFSVQA